LQLTHLKYFVTIAQLGSVTAAAKQLYVSQPALSQALSLLESELGVKLFRKAGRNNELTSIGRRLLVNAQIIIDECNLMKHECEILRTGTRNVTFSAPAVPLHVPHLVHNFYHTEPSIIMTQLPPYSDYPAEVVIGFTIDENFSDRRKRFATERIGLVVPPEHPFHESGVIDLKELADHPIVSLTKRHGMQAIEDHFCAMAGFKPVREREVDNFSEYLDMMYAGNGLFFCPFKFSGIESVHPSRIVHLVNPRCFRYVYVEETLYPESDESAIHTLSNFICHYFHGE